LRCWCRLIVIFSRRAALCRDYFITLEELDRHQQITILMSIVEIVSEQRPTEELKKFYIHFSSHLSNSSSLTDLLYFLGLDSG
jgi:hypothetical protein